MHFSFVFWSVRILAAESGPPPTFASTSTVDTHHPSPPPSTWIPVASPDPLPDVRLFQLLALRRSRPRLMSSSMFVWLSTAGNTATDPTPWITAPLSAGRHTASCHGTGSACFDEAARRQLCPRPTLPMLAAGPWDGDGWP